MSMPPVKTSYFGTLRPSANRLWARHRHRAPSVVNRKARNRPLRQTRPECLTRKMRASTHSSTVLTSNCPPTVYCPGSTGPFKAHPSRCIPILHNYGMNRARRLPDGVTWTHSAPSAVSMGIRRQQTRLDQHERLQELPAAGLPTCRKSLVLAVSIDRPLACQPNSAPWAATLAPVPGPPYGTNGSGTGNG